MVSSAYAVLVIFTASIFAISAVATWLVLRMTILAIPNQRSSHGRPVPSSGGIAIVVAAFGGMGIAGHAGIWQGPAGVHLDAYAAAAALVAMFGVADDLGRVQGAGMKLAIQVGAAVLLVSMGTVLDQITLPWIGVVDLGGLGAPLTVLWLVALTNVFNFMDGLDGLAGGVAVVIAGAITVIAFGTGDVAVLVLSLTLGAATLGFLIYNTPRARIFMGDVGSQFLGFSFAALAVIAADTSGGRFPFLVVPLLTAPLMFDVALTLLRRGSRGANLFRAHREHLYQQLQATGLPHFAVSAVHWVLTGLAAALAVWMVSLPSDIQFVAFLLVLCLQLVYFAGVRWRVRRAGAERPEPLIRRMFS